MDSRTFAIETIREALSIYAYEPRTGSQRPQSYGERKAVEGLQALALLTAEPEPCDSALTLVDRLEETRGMVCLTPEQKASIVDSYASHLTQEARDDERRKIDHAKRWNLEETEDGIHVCFGNHARSEDCEFIEYVPRSAIADERRRCADRARAIFCSLRPDDEWIEKRIVASILQGTEPAKHYDSEDKQGTYDNPVDAKPTKVSEDVERDAEVVRYAITYVKAIAIGDDSVFEDGMEAFDRLVARLKEGKNA